MDMGSNRDVPVLESGNAEAWINNFESVQEKFEGYEPINRYIRKQCTQVIPGFEGRKVFGEGRGRYVVNEDEQSKKDRRPEAGDYIDLMFEERIEISGPGKDVKLAESFEEMFRNKTLLMNIKRKNFLKPLPIQKAAFSLIRSGYDVIGHAGTGSGKTAAFLLPIIDWILARKGKQGWYPFCIVIAPAKELAEQLYTDAREFSTGLNCQCVLSFGEIPRRENIAVIESGCDILIATVGRLCDYVCNSVINLTSLHFLVFDEADRLFDQSFYDDLRRFVFPHCRNLLRIQKLLFSATDCADLDKFKEEILKPNVTTIVVGTMNSVSRFVKQEIIEVEACDKKMALMSLLREEFDGPEQSEVFLSNFFDSAVPSKVIIFVNTKRMTSVIACYLSLKGYKSYPVNGDLTTALRREAIEALLHGKCNILVSTDVTARGLDLKNISLVINYNMPVREMWASYIHRVGRTGRLGNYGRAVTFYSPFSDSGMALVLFQWLTMNGQEVPEFLVKEAEVQAAENDLRMKAEEEYRQVMKETFVATSEDED